MKKLRKLKNRIYRKVALQVYFHSDIPYPAIDASIRDGGFFYFTLIFGVFAIFVNIVFAIVNWAVS